MAFMACLNRRLSRYGWLRIESRLSTIGAERMARHGLGRGSPFMQQEINTRNVGEQARQLSACPSRLPNQEGGDG